jgi:hypothetical protein
MESGYRRKVMTLPLLRDYFCTRISYFCTTLLAIFPASI